MNRRDAVRALLALAATKPFSAYAQGVSGRSVRVAMFFGSEGNASLFRSFPEALRELGWVEGKNLVFEWRTSDGRPAELPALAAELVRNSPDVIVVPTNFEAEAIVRTTRGIPVVLLAAFDPVETGLAQSLTRPGGSVTGVVWAEAQRSSKLVEVMRESVPTIRRPAILYDERFPGVQRYIEAARVAGEAIGMESHLFPVRSAEDVAAALTRMEKERVDGIYVISGGVVAPEMPRILSYAMERRLPTGFPNPWPVERGGLMSFAPNPADVLRRTATIVDKILRGANPAGIPFEYPTRYDLTINLKTANALGIKLPQSVLLRADRLIE